MPPAALTRRWSCALAGAGAERAVTALDVRRLTDDPVTSAGAV